MDFYTKVKSDQLWLPNNHFNLIEFETYSWFNLSSQKFLNFDDSNIKLKYNKKPSKDVITKSKKITLYPNKEQKIILLQWIDSYRKIYNIGIQNFKSFLKRVGTLSHIDFRNYLLPLIPKKIKDSLMFDSLNAAISDIITAFKSAISNLKGKNIKHFRLRFKKASSPRQIVTISEKAFSKKDPNRIAPSVLGNYIISNIPFEKVTTQCIIQYNSNLNKFYLFIPYETNITPANNFTNFISLDPGIRTFMTCYTSDGEFVKIGDKNKEFFKKEYEKLDKYQSINNKKSRKKFHLLHEKLVNRIKDLHWKTISYLTTNFKTIVIGKVSTKDICQKNLAPITKRIGYQLSHFTFLQRLEFKCLERKVKLIQTEESYTSKTCTNCGNIKNDLGGKEIYNCEKCKIILNRDFNGARNILMKVM